MIVLSLEAERIISGFSDDVANAVTQPLWPITHKLERDEIRWDLLHTVERPS